MSLTEVLPEIQNLSRTDKVQLVSILSNELNADVLALIEPGQSYPIWSPHQAFSAAAAILKVLEDEKGNP